MPNWSNNIYIDALMTGSKVGNATINYYLDPSFSAWTAVERTAMENAFASWAKVANLKFVEVFDISQAQFVEVKSTTDILGAGTLADHQVPADAYDGTTIQSVDLVSGDFLRGRFASNEGNHWDAGGLTIGGEAFQTIVHELGHGLGLDHTHADFASDPHKFPNATDDQTPGDFGLNDMLYSAMSYYNGPLLRDPVAEANGSNYGVNGSPMAFDIAAIQFLYGANTTTASGDDVYIMPDANQAGTYWTSIWDTNGADTIQYNGSKATTIDLRAATLQKEEGGGGFVSYAEGIYGGFTIANGVVIEKAIGGSGNDEMMGNSANNTMYGNDGNDEIDGMSGVNMLYGGKGDDKARLSNKDASGAEIYAGRFNGDEGMDDLYVSDDAGKYKIYKHGDSMVFRHQDYTAENSLGRAVASAKDIEMFEGQNLSNYTMEDGFGARSKTANGTAPTDMSAIRDFDGNDLGSSSSWKNIGQADVQFDGDAEFIYINQDNGRWATVGPDASGNVDFGGHGQGGDTRVVGIYIDPEVEAGRTVKFSDFDSQQRFQNDLKIDNLTVIDAFDFDADNFQEIYFKVNDGTAYLRALMHADGNIQYANYQSEDQVRTYLTDLGYGQDVLDTILI